MCEELILLRRLFFLARPLDESGSDIISLTVAALEAWNARLRDKVSALSHLVTELRDEIARLKGLKERPAIKLPSQHSGIEQAIRLSRAGISKRLDWYEDGTAQDRRGSQDRGVGA